MAGRPGRTRPFIFVLAGVNGAGKSSVGGAILRARGLTWYNPDAFARELMARTGVDRAAADGEAWEYGRARLEAATAEGTNFAIETTLGGTTIARLLGEAAATHDVIMVFCGVSSVEQHIARVKARVLSGGHDIPEERIRARWDTSRENLIALLPRLAELQVFDNSAEAAPGEDIPDPVLVLEMKDGRVLHPGRSDVEALESTPVWAKPVVAAAFHCRVAETGCPGRGASK